MKSWKLYSPKTNIFDYISFINTKFFNIAYILPFLYFYTEIKDSENFFTVIPLLIGESVSDALTISSNLGNLSKKNLFLKLLITLIMCTFFDISTYEPSLREIKSLNNLTDKEVSLELYNCDLCYGTGEVSLYWSESLTCFPFNPKLHNKSENSYLSPKHNSTNFFGNEDEKYYQLDFTWNKDEKFYLNYNVNVELDFTVGCEKGKKDNIYIKNYKVTTNGSFRWLNFYSLGILLDYVIYLPSLYFLPELQFRGFSFMLILMNSLTLVKGYDLFLKMFISIVLSITFSNIDDTIKRKSILLVKKYFIKKSLFNENNCLRQFYQNNENKEILNCKISRNHISPGKYKINKILLLKIYFTGLLMKPITEFDYFDIMFSLFNQIELNILKESFSEKLFSRQGYTKDYNYFMQSLGSVSDNYKLLKRKSKGVFKIDEKRRRLNEFLCKNLTLKCNKFLSNHNASFINFKFIDIISSKKTLINRDVSETIVKDFFGEPLYKKIYVKEPNLKTFLKTEVIRESLKCAGVAFKYKKVRLGLSDITVNSIMSEWDYKIRHKVRNCKVMSDEVKNTRKKILDAFFNNRETSKIIKNKFTNNLKRGSPIKQIKREENCKEFVKSVHFFKLVSSKNFVNLDEISKTKQKLLKVNIEENQLKSSLVDLSGNPINNLSQFMRNIGILKEKKVQNVIDEKRVLVLKIPESEFIQKLSEMKIIRNGVANITNNQFKTNLDYFNKAFTQKPSFKSLKKSLKTLKLQ
jgi:hypothetical protein